MAVAHFLQLLNKQHLADALEVAEMLDGVIVFEHDMDADKYSSMLEEEGHSQVGRCLHLNKERHSAAGALNGSDEV